MALSHEWGDNRGVKQARELQALVRTAHAQRRDAVEQRARVVAGNEQRVIDAQVASTRRDLLRLARRSSPSTSGYLDPEFLAVADRSTVWEAILEAAVALPGVSAVDRVRDSDVFADATAVEMMMAAGSRAVYSFPLLSAGRVLGVMSLHGKRPLAKDHFRVLTSNAAVAWAAVTPQGGGR